MHKLLQIGMALHLLITGAFTGTSLTFQASPHSVTISASDEQVPPGASTTVTVHMFTSLNDVREILDVFLPEGMSVTGLPVCSGACTGASVTPGTNNVTATFDVGSYDPNPRKSATLSFTVTVSPEVQPGTYLSISAYLGSPAASDSVGIKISALPTRIPASLSLSASPDGVIVEPRAAFTVVLFPYLDFFPEDRILTPAMVIEAAVPAGLSLEKSSSCFEAGVGFTGAPSLCSIEITSEDDDSTLISIEIPERAQQTGIVLHFYNHGLSVGNAGTLDFSLAQSSASTPVLSPSKSVDVIAVESITSTGGNLGAGSFNILVISPETGCLAPYIEEGASVALVEWGRIDPIITKGIVHKPNHIEGMGHLDTRCPMLISFSNVEPRPYFSVGAPGAEWLGCRRCVIGTVPWVENAIPIIVPSYD